MSEISSQLDAARERLRAQAPAPGYLTKAEAARLARCSERTIQRAIASGHLPAYRPVKQILIAEEDLRAWVQSEPACAHEPEHPRTRPRRVKPSSVADILELERSAR